MMAMMIEQVGKYPVVRTLGQGASSEVLLCHDPFNKREVAIKRMFPEFMHDKEKAKIYERFFLTEASLIGRLLHPHIVQIYDAVLEPEAAYIVMEYVPGGTLEPFCKIGSLLPADEVIEIIFKCSRALAHAHGAGITHRDIKPGNILLAGGSDIKISDFGAALGAPVETTQVSGVGSPAYMSPEQIREEPVDFRTDIYSLGVVMYQLLTGVLPFCSNTSYNLLMQILDSEPKPPSIHRSNVPMMAEKIVRRAMQKDRNQRYQSWEEFSYDLLAALRADRAAVNKKAFGDTDKFEALRTMRFFGHFNDAEIWQVLALTSWETVAADTELMREGKPGDFFCVLVEGSMRVTKNGRLLSMLAIGECFGEMAYLSRDDGHRHATVTAAVDSRVARIRISDLERAPASCRHKFDRALMASVVERLSFANDRLTIS